MHLMLLFIEVVSHITSIIPIMCLSKDISTVYLHLYFTSQLYYFIMTNIISTKALFLLKSSTVFINLYICIDMSVLLEKCITFCSYSFRVNKFFLCMQLMKKSSLSKFQDVDFFSYTLLILLDTTLKMFHVLPLSLGMLTNHID